MADANISDIIQIQITRETQSVAVPNFGIPLLVDEADDASPPFTGRTKAYASLAELSTDGYTAGDYVYDSAANIFSQNPAVSSIKVGLKYITTTPDASWTAAMDAIRAFDVDWYGFTIISETLADQKEVADWAEAIKDPKVLFIIRSNDADILDNAVTTDIAYYLQTNSYERSAVYYHPGTNAEYIDAAAIGERFPKDPGTGTWMFKTLKSVSVYSLTSAERANALAKNANVFLRRAGISMAEEGTVGFGEYLDIIRGTDWLESIIQTDLFSVLVNTEKIPYNDFGIANIESIVRGSLQRAVNSGLINEDFIVNLPAAADVPTIDKSNRILNNVTFTATYQGAIHKISIAGTISL